MTINFIRLLVYCSECKWYIYYPYVAHTHLRPHHTSYRLTPIVTGWHDGWQMGHSSHQVSPSQCQQLFWQFTYIFMKLSHQMRRHLRQPGTGCIIMTTSVHFSDSEPFVVVLMTSFLGTVESVWKCWSTCMNTKSISWASAKKSTKMLVRPKKKIEKHFAWTSMACNAVAFTAWYSRLTGELTAK